MQILGSIESYGAWTSPKFTSRSILPISTLQDDGDVIPRMIMEMASIREHDLMKEDIEFSLIIFFILVFIEQEISQHV